MRYDWRFPILDGGKKQGINDSGIATFAGSELYNNLAREICQNSLDAKDIDSKEPVIVSFNLKSIYKPSFNPINRLYDILVSCKNYWSKFDDHKLNSFLQEAFDTLSSETIDVLVVSDFNTNGLYGSKDRTGSWDALTGSNGVSYKVNGSQGSFGIGKNAPYACSSLRTVFYNTYCKQDKQKAFQGVTSLVTHLDNNFEETQGCGFYYNVDDRLPIYNIENIPDLSIFNRQDFGTDIIILGFKKNVNWKNDIKSAIIKNFFISILDSKLIVRIDNEEINKNTILSIMNNEIIASGDNDLKRVKKYCDTYLNPNKIFKTNILSKNDTSLYVRLEDDYDRSISYFRASGMLIFEKKIKKMKPYQAVLVVKDGNFNDLLKLTEPPKHDKWDYKLLDDLERPNGRNSILKLNKFIVDSIETLCKLEEYDEIDPDGLSDFLPDDIFESEKKQKTNISAFNGDTLEISNIKKIANIISNEVNNASIDLGSVEEGDVHNDVKSNNDIDDICSIPGYHSTDEDIIVEKEKDGSKIIVTDLKANVRVIPIDYKKGEYFLSCKFDQAYVKANIEFLTLGEDGTMQSLMVISYTLNNNVLNINNKYIQLENLVPDQQYQIKVNFNSKSRMVILTRGVGYETAK